MGSVNITLRLMERGRPLCPLERLQMLACEISGSLGHRSLHSLSDLPMSSGYYHHQILLSKLRISSPEEDVVPWIGTNEEEELMGTRPDWSKLTGEREARG